MILKDEEREERLTDEEREERLTDEMYRAADIVGALADEIEEDALPNLGKLIPRWEWEGARRRLGKALAAAKKWLEDNNV